MHNDALARHRGYGILPTPSAQQLSLRQIRQAEATTSLVENPRVRSVLWASDGALVITLTEPLPSRARGIVFRPGTSRLETLRRAQRALARRFPSEVENPPTDQLPDGYAMLGGEEE